MFKDKLEADLKRVVKELGFIYPTDTVVYIPENSSFGDYSSNIPLQLSKQKHKDSYQSPKEIANAILEKLGHPNYLERIEIAGPGFLNFFLKDDSLLSLLNASKYGKEAQPESNHRYLVEFAHPNTHKSFHIGHLRNISIGEAVSRLLEFQGDQVFRVTYGGDIGPHVAKAIWGTLKLKEQYEEVKKQNLRSKAEFLGKAYALAENFYHEDSKAKEEIDEINEKLYAKDPSLMPVWEETKDWSKAYFDTIYQIVGTEFDAQIWESEVEEVGKLIVKENLSKVFVEDQDAIIFPGEKYGLHNRVFITQKGYPTYEAKELGLTRREQELFPFDTSLHIVASEQAGFFHVVIKALELIEAIGLGSKKHVSYGMVNLASGKMSSRKGSVITAESLIEEVSGEIKKNYTQSKLGEQDLQKIAIAAIKFFFLKYSFGSDITFDIQKSISLQGDSGPYVLYVYARIVSLLNRAKSVEPVKKTADAQNQKIAQQPDFVHPRGVQTVLEPKEREVLRQIEYFELVAEKAAKNLHPNELTSYLLNLSKTFNSFYESCPILTSDKQIFRLELIRKTAEIIKLGLYLLGIETVERM